MRDTDVIWLLDNREYAKSIRFSADILLTELVNKSIDKQSLHHIYTTLFKAKPYLVPLEHALTMFSDEHREDVEKLYRDFDRTVPDNNRKIMIEKAVRAFNHKMQMQTAADVLKSYHQAFEDGGDDLSNDGLCKQVVSALHEKVPQQDEAVADDTDFFSDIFDPKLWDVDKGEVMTTYYKNLDTMLNGGWQKKRFSAILAGSGTGKSTLLCTMAARQMMNGRNVAYANLEMTNAEVTLNMMSVMTRTPYDELENNPDANRVRIMEEKHDWGRCAIIDDSQDLTLDRMAEKLLSEEERGGFKYDIIFIDYLDLFDTETKHDRPDQKLKALAKNAKRLAKRNNWSVVSLLQTNRSGQNDNGELTFAQKIGESYSSMQEMDNCFEFFFMDGDDDKRVLRAAKVRQNKNTGTVGSRFCLVYDDEYKEYRESNEPCPGGPVRTFHKIVDNFHDKVKQCDLIKRCGELGISANKGTVSKYYARMGYGLAKETEQGALDGIRFDTLDSIYGDKPLLGLDNVTGVNVTGKDLF